MMVYAIAQFDATDDSGKLLEGVLVEVRRETGGPQVVYSDRDGTTPLGSQFTSSTGKIKFHAPGGSYRIRLTKGAYQREMRYFAIGLAAETDAAVAVVGGLYPNTTAGLAATDEGGYFHVPGVSAGEVYATLYRKVSGAAAAQGVAYPSLAAIQSVRDSIAPAATNSEMIAGSATDKMATPANTRALVLDRLGEQLRASDIPVESGYLYGIVDSLMRLALGIDTAGKTFAILRDDAIVPRAALVSEVRDALLAGSTSGLINSESGFLWAIEDAAHRVGLGLKPDGTFWARFADDIVLPPSFSAAVRDIILPTADIVCWGDSLTAGAGGSGTTYPAVLATALGRLVTNQGIGGQTSEQVAARQGGVAIIVTVSGNSIPASGGVAVTAKSINILTSSGAFTGASIGTLAGIAGTMTTDGSGNWTFTRSASGSATACPAGTPFIPDDAALLAGKTVIIQVGQNDTKSTRANVSALRENVLAMVSRLTPLSKRVLVMAISGSAGSASGSAGYLQMKAANDELRSIFGDHFIDHRRYLIDFGLADAGISPTGQDLTDIANDVIPESLRAPADPIHGNAAFYTLTGNFMARQIKARGW